MLYTAVLYCHFYFCFMALDIWLLYGTFYEKKHPTRTINRSADLGRRHGMYIAPAKVLCKKIITSFVVILGNKKCITKMLVNRLNERLEPHLMR